MRTPRLLILALLSLTFLNACGDQGPRKVREPAAAEPADQGDESGDQGERPKPEGDEQ